jgi:carbon-monoxide dehydrogenase medium subunit
MMKQRELVPESVVNIKNIPELAYIREDREGLKIGALTTISMLVESDIIKKKYLALHEAAAGFGTWEVRNMATLGGNICQSLPSGDTFPPLLAFGAEVKLVGPKGERRVPIEKFCTGPGTNVLDRELLVEVILPKQKGKYGSAYDKKKRSSVDLAKASCAINIAVKDGKCEDIKVAMGALADKPIRARTVEEALKSKALSDEIIEAAAQKVTKDISPRTSVRSTAWYRSEVSKVLVRRLIKLAAERCSKA